MTQHVNAIYENGVLKPLKPLDLKDQEIVSLSIDRRAEKGQELDHDDEYLPLVAEDGDPNVTWETVQAVLAKLPDSLTEDFNRERDERF
ncbi:MAG: antitoxin family protein [Pirellulales bacterium]